VPTLQPRISTRKLDARGANCVSCGGFHLYTASFHWPIVVLARRGNPIDGDYAAHLMHDLLRVHPWDMYNAYQFRFCAASTAHMTPAGSGVGDSSSTTSWEWDSSRPREGYCGRKKQAMKSTMPAVYIDQNYFCFASYSLS
jgi:hypothetical protein